MRETIPKMGGLDMAPHTPQRSAPAQPSLGADVESPSKGPLALARYDVFPFGGISMSNIFRIPRTRP